VEPEPAAAADPAAEPVPLAPQDAAVWAEGLSKRYKAVLALDQVDLAIPRGEIFGLLGPNGAGKSTAIKILATLTRATTGHARVAGFDVQRQQDGVRRAIGIVFQEPSLDEQLTARENLDFHARMYGLPRALRRERSAELLALVELEDRADSRVDTYSGGMKRRLEIARGLMHHPQVLFLDEPTLGLDARTRRQIWEHVRQLNRERGVTVILSTHYMEEADSLCGRVAVVDRGRIVALDTPEGLKGALGGDGVELELETPRPELAARLRAEPWVLSLHEDGDTLRLRVDRGPERLPGLFAWLAEQRAPALRVSLSRPSLEDVFLSLTGSSLAEAQNQAKPESLAQRVRRRMWRR